MSNCTQLSSLVLSVHGLPNVSNVGNDPVILNSSDGEIVHLFTADLNSRIRTWFWGAFIVVLTSAVLYATCFYFCCVCCCFCCESTGGKRKSKSRKLKLGCGLVNITLIVCTLGLVCVSIWYEVEVNNGIADGYDSVLDFISIDNDSTGTGFPELMTRTDYFERFEYYRYRVALGYLGFVLLMLVFSIVGITLASALRTAGTAIISVLIGLFAVIAFLMSMLAGATYTFLIYYSDLCLDIYAVGGNSLCTNPNFVSFIDPLNTLCNDVFMDTFILVMFGCALVVVFILLQIFSAIYAGSLTGKEKRQFETSEREIVISSPVMASGVWNSYGAKTILGVKSHTQPVTQRYPPPYPLDSVAPETPRSAVTRGDSTENGIRSPARGYQDATV